MVTIVEGIEDTAIDLGQLAKILKGACASGGTVKGRTIELQGDHKKKAAKVTKKKAPAKKKAAATKKPVKKPAASKKTAKKKATKKKATKKKAKGRR